MYFPFSITVTVRRQHRDSYGDITLGEEFTVAHCVLVNQSGSSALQNSAETVDFRDEVNTRRNLLVPRGADIRPTDEIVLPDGTRWEAKGEPAAPHNPFTDWRPGQRVAIGRVTG